MMENRLTVRLTNMWEKLAEFSPPPMFAQFNTAPISDIWQQCATLKIEPSASSETNFTMIVEFMGDLAQKLLPDFREGARIGSKSMSMQAKKYLSGIGEVINECKTIINSGSLVGHNNKMVKYRVCLLPFTDKNAKVAYIVVGFSWIEC
jgi:hypothetical protein